MNNHYVGRTHLAVSLILCLLGCNNNNGSPSIEPGPVDGGLPDSGPPQMDSGVPDGSVPDAGPTTCSQSSECESGQACVETECLDGNGTCMTDNDCGADTYCCEGACLENAGDPPICIPYGTGPRGPIAPVCEGSVAIGRFTADIQCEWLAPEPGDPYPTHINVLVTPLVADLPYDSGASAEIIIVTYNCEDGGNPAGAGTSASCFGVIRVLNGQTCEQVDVFADASHPIIGASTPAIGNLDAPGVADEPEIVTHRALGGVVAFGWNETTAGYEYRWHNTDTDMVGLQHWDGPAIHDLNDDGAPEVLSGPEVYDGATGARRNDGQTMTGRPGNGAIAVAGDMDGDGAVELAHGEIYRWNDTTSQWDLAYDLPVHAAGYYALADFGTPGAAVEDFQVGVFDGRAEVAAVSNGAVRLFTLEGQTIMNRVGGVSSGIVGGGPPTIGDFDADGVPEIASAGGTAYRIFDLGCAPDGPQRMDCAADYIRWEQTSQDGSSNRTGSSIFDFDSDGQAEAVYADECFTRIYEGDSGAVLYSASRTSCTWYENPVIADPDKDSNTEILVGSNKNCSITCPTIDPIHPGLTCDENEDCASGTCDEGFCRCTMDEQCGDDYRCSAPLAGTPGTGNTCRAYHPPGTEADLTGVRVLRDSLDRWASSRPLWNQHPYSVTNINDDLSVPQTSAWVQNFSDPDDLNNYRQNIQGDASAGDLPDITGKLDKDTLCAQPGVLTATVCNRGRRAVGAALPATFYDDTMAVICTSFTAEPVPIGECRPVSCDLPMSVGGVITMIVNDDGMGGRTTVECNDDNNTDSVGVAICPG